MRADEEGVVADGEAEHEAVEAVLPRVDVVLGQAEVGLVAAVAAPVDVGAGGPAPDGIEGVRGEAGGAAEDGLVEEVEEVGGGAARVREREDAEERVEDAPRWGVGVADDMVGEADAVVVGAEDGVHDRGVGVEVGDEDEHVVGAEARERLERVEELVAEDLQLAEGGCARRAPGGSGPPDRARRGGPSWCPRRVSVRRSAWRAGRVLEAALARPP